jgi:hypothetical protein
MNEYIHPNGYTYTEDELASSAKKENMTLDEFISNRGIKPKKKKEKATEEVTTKVPGKRKSVAREDAGATVKSTVSKSAKPSSVSTKVNLLKTSGVDDFASSLVEDKNQIKTGIGSSSIMWKDANKKIITKKVAEQDSQAKKQLELNKTAEYRTKVAKDEISFDNPDTVLKYDLEDESEVNTVSKLNKKLNRLGIEVSQNNFSDTFNFKLIDAKPGPTTGGEEAKLVVGRDFDPKDQKGMNEYISEIKDINYISKAKQRVSKTNPNYLSKITPPSLAPEEKTKQARNAMVAKFKDLEQDLQSNTSSLGIGGSFGAAYTGITKQDFENPDDYNLYKTWKKTGILPELNEEKIIAWDKNRKSDFIERASTEYSRTLLPSERKDLQIIGQEAINENKHAVKAFDQAIAGYNVRAKEFETKFKDYKLAPSKTIEEGKLLQDEFLSLQAEQNNLGDRQKQLETETNTTNEVMLPAIESFGANYNRFSQLVTATKSTVANVGVGLKDLSAYGSAILTGSTHEEVMKRDTSGFVYLAGEMNKKQKEYQKAVGINKITSFDDAGNWLMSGIVNNVPSIGMAFTGPAAMPLFFASGYGGKSTQMAIEAEDAKTRLSENYYNLKNTTNPFEQAGLEQQIAKDEALLSLPEYKKFGAKALYGASEVTFEILGTLKILKGLGDATKLLPKKTLQEGLIWAGKTNIKNFKTEGLSELGTTLSNNFIDYAILGEDKNFFDVATESLESFAQGGIMGTGFGGVDTVKVLKRAVVSELAEKKQSKRIQEIAKQISELTGVSGYTLNQGIPLPEQTPAVQKLVTELIDESESIESNIINRLGVDLTLEQATQIGDVNRQIRSVNKDFLEAVNDGSLQPAQLKVLEGHYRGKFNELISQRETLLTDPNIKAENIKSNNEARFHFDLTNGYGMYNKKMQQTSINQIATNFNNLDAVKSQELLSEAKQELELSNEKNVSEKVIKQKAFENYAENHYTSAIKDGINNAQEFAKNNDVNIDLLSFEGADANASIVEAYKKTDKAKSNPKSISEFKKGIEDGTIEGANATVTEIDSNGIEVTKDVALVHIKNSALNGRTGVGSHEVLHSAVKKAFIDQKGVDKAGADLLNYLEKYDANLHALVTARIDASYSKKDKKGLRLRDEKGELIKDTDYYEEALNALSDLSSDGVELPKDSLNATRNFVNNLLPNWAPKFKENEGANVYQFIKDYNKEAHFGKKEPSNLIKFAGKAFGGDPEKIALSKSPVELVKQKLVDLEENEGDYDPDEYDQEVRKLEGELKRAIAKEATAQPTIKKEVSEEDVVKEIIKNESGSISSDKVQKIYETKGESGAYDIIKLFKPITNKIVDKRKNAPGFDRVLFTDEIETGVGGILDLIKSYNKSIPLAAWINKYLPFRAIATSRRILDKQFSKDATEEKGLMATETADQGFTEAAKEKPKYKNALESKVFAPEVLETVTKKIVTIIRTIKSRIDAPISLNKTVTPLISEIRDEVGKQLDIDVKTAMGGKKDNQLQNWLIDNKQYVLENMTTTWLMGKDGQGGMPIAIQKQIDGKWTNFPDWVGKKIDREKTTTDQAGRTSGAELVRRLPNVNNNISDSQFLDQIIGPDGNPLRGRKESLAKAVAEETAFDIINEDIENDGPISEAFKANQERQGVEITGTFAIEVIRQAERGNVKYSKSAKEKLAISEAKTDLFDWIKTLTPNEYSTIKTYLGYDKRDINFKTKSPVLSQYLIYARRLEAAKQENLGSLANRLGSIESEEALERLIKANKSNDKKLIEELTTFLRAEVKSYKTNSGNFITTNKEYLTYVLQPALDKILGIEKTNQLFNDNIISIEEKIVNGEPRSYIFVDSKRIDSYMPITNIKTVLSKNSTDVVKLIDIINSEADLASNHVLKTLTYYRDLGGAKNIEKGLNHITLLGTDMQGSLRKMYKMGFYTSNLKAKDVILEHNTTINDLKSELRKYLNKEITLPQLKNYINTLKINLIPKQADQALTDVKLKYTGKNRNENLEFVEALVPFKKYLHDITSMYKSKARFDRLVKEATAGIGARQTRLNNETISAVVKSIQPSKTLKGISVFDFDDTVGLTSGSVLYTMSDGSTGKLNAEEFAKEGGDMLDAGAVFDFSEFSKVVDGKPGPMVEKMKKMIGKFGPENFFILTARPANAAGPIHEFLSSIGIDIPLENITGLGSSLAQSKADWMTAKAAEGYNDFYFADDAIQNVEAVKKALNISGVDSKVQQAMVKFSLTSKQDLKWTYYEDSSFADFEVKGKSYKIELADSAYIDYPELLIPTINTLIEKYNLNKDDILQERTGKTYQLIFEGYKGGTEITGTGNAAEVFGVVINGVIEYAKNKNIETFVFAAKEPSRRKLYNAMANVIANKIGWNSFYDNGVYIISKKGTAGNIETFNNQNNQVKNVLNVVDIKSPIQQAKIKFSKTISSEFNKIISKNTGIGPAIEYSDIVAKRKGANKNLFDLYVPASAADFELLLYNFLGKGIEGEAQMKFFSDALLKPYANGNDLMDAARQSIKNNYKELIKAFPGIAKKLEKLTPDGNFTYDQALRVAMWNGSDVEIPGLSKRDTSELTSLVNNDTELYDFMSGLVVLGRQGNGWVKPGENWDASTIISDLHNLTEGDGRKQFLAEFIDNAQEMFGKWDNGKLVGPNINKVEAIYGTDVRESIEDVLYRMTTGKNRSQGKDKITNKWLDWVSGSTGTIMFLNTRSAALQLIGAVNFLNLRDNNPIAAGAAFANQPQYWADFARIWNSDKMKERRGGLKEDVAAAEIANAAATSRNKPTAVISYLLKIGYTPTQLADSFAIASGGAPFYRNRIKSYLKEGLTEQEAEAAAWSDFTKVSDETQQSGDPRDISKQQASGAGRLLLTFQNTAMQQSRIVKKSFLDLKNGRGDAKTHIAKIAYYLAIQNLMFSVLQQGLFAVLFHDEDEEDEVKKKRLKEKDKKIIEVASGVVDSVVRGTGLLGGVLVTLKNVIKKYMEEEPKGYKADYTKVVLEATNISPPIGSKVRKIYSGLQQTKFDKDLIKERGWGVMQDGRVHLGPMYSIVGKGVEATVNFPMERLVNKVENTSQMFNSQNQAWQRVMVGLGWNPRSVGIEETGGDVAIEAKAKEVRKEEGKIKGAETRERTKDSIRALPMVERMRIKREAAIKRREAKIKKRKRKMG